MQISGGWEVQAEETANANFLGQGHAGLVGSTARGP